MKPSLRVPDGIALLIGEFWILKLILGLQNY